MKNLKKLNKMNTNENINFAEKDEDGFYINAPNYTFIRAAFNAHKKYVQKLRESRIRNNKILFFIFIIYIIIFLILIFK